MIDFCFFFVGMGDLALVGEHISSGLIRFLETGGRSFGEVAVAGERVLLKLLVAVLVTRGTS